MIQLLSPTKWNRGVTSFQRCYITPPGTVSVELLPTWLEYMAWAKLDFWGRHWYQCNKNRLILILDFLYIENISTMLLYLAETWFCISLLKFLSEIDKYLLLDMTPVISAREYLQCWGPLQYSFPWWESWGFTVDKTKLMVCYLLRSLIMGGIFWHFVHWTINQDGLSDILIMKVIVYCSIL